MTTRETSFRESDHPGIVFPEKKPSGKITIRETTVNRTVSTMAFVGDIGFDEIPAYCAVIVFF